MRNGYGGRGRGLEMQRAVSAQDSRPKTHGFGRGPGRPRIMRRIALELEADYFKPAGIPMRELEMVSLTLEETEAIRLSDLDDLEQEDAAAKMGISRRTFWRELQSARKKIADALVNGKAIKIEKEVK